MSEAPVRYETTPEAIWITLDRPDTMNLIDEEVFEHLTECFIRARFDEEHSVVVLRGSGRMFSAGGNLGEGQELIDLAKRGFSERLARVMYEHVHGDYPAFHAIESCPKTVICALNGSAYGAGAVLALQTGITLDQYGARTFVGRLVSATMVKELGPVLAAIAFDTEAQALAIANDTVYGLAGAVFTRDMDRAHRFSEAVHAGTVWINTYDMSNFATPFGGFKQSGFGRDRSVHAIDKYCDYKTIWQQFG